MGDLAMFPISRSPAHVERLVEAMDALQDEVAMTAHWRDASAQYIGEFLDQTIPAKVLDRELNALFHTVVSIVSERQFERFERAARREKRRARLRLVEPAQGDLFAPPLKPFQSIPTSDHEANHAS